MSISLTYRFRFNRLLMGLTLTCLPMAGLWPALATAQVGRPDPPATTEPAPKVIRSFLESSCYDCHVGPDAGAGLDLERLSDHLDDASAESWVRIHDRVKAGEMPPADYNALDAERVDTFTATASEWITNHQRSQLRSLGRVRSRRLTNLQLERTLHDLLAIDVPLVPQLPEEPRTRGYTGIAANQSMSHFQLEQHLDVVDLALDAAFSRARSGDPVERKSRALDPDDLSRPKSRRRNREPEVHDGAAVVWSGRMPFYGQLQRTTAREAGWFRFKLTARALNPPPSGEIWCTIHSGQCISTAPLLNWVDSFTVTTQPRTIEFEAWLPAGHMLEIRPGDATLKQARFRGGQVETGVGAPQKVPGLAMESLEVQRIHRHPVTDLRRMLFGNLAASLPTGEPTVAALPSDRPAQDLRRLIGRFARRAFRRPVDADSIQPFLDLALETYQQDHDLVTALRDGYRAILCSPRFLYLVEQPGQLDDFEIATRLSYFLWNRMPDATLFRLAEAGELRKPEVLHRQVDRLLNDPRGQSFVVDLADQWLDLSQINFTTPDPRRFGEFDSIVQHAMLTETHRYLDAMVREDLGVRYLVDSDFTFLNSRLAAYYRVQDRDSIRGDQWQRAELRPNDHRGGLITQGSILKITANGTTTSPVVRGVWISERILGQEIPPPPANVPAIEPDVRGATTIREMLVKHQSIESCAACHRKIDPPGFAMEMYDPAGRYRESYISLTRENGRRKTVRKPIDASSQLPDGRRFEDVDQFQQLLVEQPEPLARNLVEQLMVYATGAQIQFADRPAVHDCVRQGETSNYGFRTLIKAVVTSEPFLTK